MVRNAVRDAMASKTTVVHSATIGKEVLMMIYGMFVLRCALRRISSCGTRAWRHVKMTGLTSRRRRYIGPGDDTITLDGVLYRKSPAAGGRCRRWRRSVLPVARPLIEGDGQIYGM